MANDIRVKRLEKLALQRASEVVLHELADPRIGFLTLTRVKLSSDFSHLTIWWSAIGSDADRSRMSHALADARSHVQREIAHVFHTRRTPQVRFEFDPSIEGALRVDDILTDLARERGDDDEIPEVPVQPD